MLTHYISPYIAITAVSFSYTVGAILGYFTGQHHIREEVNPIGGRRIMDSISALIIASSIGYLFLDGATNAASVLGHCLMAFAIPAFIGVNSLYQDIVSGETRPPLVTLFMFLNYMGVGLMVMGITVGWMIDLAPFTMTGLLVGLILVYAISCDISRPWAVFDRITHY